MKKSAKVYVTLKQTLKKKEVNARVFANVDKWKNKLKTGPLYHTMPEAGVTKISSFLCPVLLKM